MALSWGPVADKSKCIDCVSRRDSRLLRRSGDMSDVCCLTDEQMATLTPIFPKSHKEHRVNHRRVLSGIECPADCRGLAASGHAYALQRFPPIARPRTCPPCSHALKAEEDCAKNNACKAVESLRCRPHTRLKSRRKRICTFGVTLDGIPSLRYGLEPLTEH
jgi:hypothetical protein